ncbi:hypothetical protein [Rhizobium glycinendophyticum]|uniref:Uncharacterized protein n=1 Tax=Rhizobium glycinendophyticum TaxID=2589807 RepID=A0A504U8U1_9HYPH|nr:hypothetical protein [Rhizobium glycinendophyticum]TPP11584.1 hypothetical protein FJQ55_12520 [Rhizobium glycinendophyticum]
MIISLFRLESSAETDFLLDALADTSMLHAKFSTAKIRDRMHIFRDLHRRRCKFSRDAKIGLSGGATFGCGH